MKRIEYSPKITRYEVENGIVIFVTRQQYLYFVQVMDNNTNDIILRKTYQNKRSINNVARKYGIEFIFHGTDDRSLREMMK